MSKVKHVLEDFIKILVIFTLFTSALILAGYIMFNLQFFPVFMVIFAIGGAILRNFTPTELIDWYWKMRLL